MKAESLVACSWVLGCMLSCGRGEFESLRGEPDGGTDGIDDRDPSIEPSHGGYDGGPAPSRCGDGFVVGDASARVDCGVLREAGVDAPEAGHPWRDAEVPDADVGGSACRTDCDCPWWEGACTPGGCRPVSRPNLCCSSPTCIPGRECVWDDGSRDRCPGPRDAGTPTPDGGTSSTVGTPCRDGWQCPDDLACLEWGDEGYCTKQCDDGVEFCPAGSGCFAIPGAEMQLCLATCAQAGGQSNCRDGFHCFGPRGGQGVCIPDPGR